ncbi:hypothetical protein AB0G04_33785 [Actinoplanes sp. NPDC023801]|uniref:hypothetical protein n=1 Tax=Actinoplanes sp. NPDC023801 TaxID=3154595 RepID=UPI0033D66D20
MLSRTRCAAGIVVLTVLLPGTTAVDWWTTETEWQVRHDLREVNSALGAVERIESTLGRRGPQYFPRGIDVVALMGPLPMPREGEMPGATMHRALSLLDSGELTLEERTLRKPLRLAVDEYLDAQEVAERDGIDAGIDPPGHRKRVETLGRQLRISLWAREDALRSGLEMARTLGDAAQVTAFLLSVLAVFLASRLMPHRKHRSLR